MKKKTKLQKKKDNSNSIYWRTKCDILWSKLVRDRDGNVCVICGKENSQAHHIIPKKGNRKVRHEFWNGISLCPKHHKWDYQFSAHKCSAPFYNWLIEHRKGQWDKCVVYTDPEYIDKNELGNDLSFKDRYNKLMEMEKGE